MKYWILQWENFQGFCLLFGVMSPPSAVMMYWSVPGQGLPMPSWLAPRLQRNIILYWNFKLHANKYSNFRKHFAITDSCFIQDKNSYKIWWELCGCLPVACYFPPKCCLDSTHNRGNWYIFDFMDYNNRLLLNVDMVLSNRVNFKYGPEVRFYTDPSAVIKMKVRSFPSQLR